MTSPSHQRLSDLFFKASELEGNDRKEFLDRVCTGDPELRAELDSLLSHDRDVPEVLQTGALAAKVVGTADPLPDSVGPYKIQKMLGQGGMGVVYRAEQEQPLRRLVAIKLIKLGIATEEVIARFESERRALALMNHPNVTRVFDAGTTEQGLPYFAMEYVEGQPINDYCNEHQLGIAERLALFMQVCDGVQHAHQNAVIHRDVKPSNVLVTLQDGKPVPKIIDFGIAKATDHRFTERTMFTQMGQLVGTPEYMSPEQSGMNGQEVDTRTDVYSLGVLLFELIVGALPFDPAAVRKSGLDEIRRMIYEDEPPKPSACLRSHSDARRAARDRKAEPAALARRLRGDLDWITIKAMEKQRDRRYGSPSELAADIGRHLRHEPVQAGPPGATYRMKKFFRKHRAIASFAAAFLVLLFGFAITSAIQASRISREAATTEQVSEFLVDLFEASTRIGPRASGGSTFELLESNVEKIERELQDQPLLRARLLHATGDVYRRIGQSWEASRLLEEAHAEVQDLLGADHPTTLNVSTNLAQLYLDLGRLDEAELVYLDVLEKRRRLLGPNHPDTLRSSAFLAYLYKAAGRNDEAESLFHETLSGMRRVFGDDHPETLISAGFLAGVYLEQGKLNALEPLLLELRQKMPAVLGEDHLETMAATYNLACLYAIRGDRDQAFYYLRQVIDSGFGYNGSLFEDRHLENLYGDPLFDAIARRAWFNRADMQFAAKNRADFYKGQGRFDEAEILYRGVLQAVSRVPEADPDAVWYAAWDLADLYLMQGRYAEAEPLALDALRAVRSEYGESSQYAVDALCQVAQCRLGRGDRNKATELFEEAQSIFEKPRHGGRANTSGSFYFQAVLSNLAGDRKASLTHLRQAGQTGYWDSTWLSRELGLRSLHGDPEFEAIIADIKAQYGM